MKGPDPRANPAPVSELPRLVAEGAARFDAAEFWHAHESWEEGWHALRGAGEEDTALFLKGMILAAAALENAKRGKEDGFKRQMAEGLALLRENRQRATRLGLTDADAWIEALVDLYLAACRRRDWSQWNTSGWRAPPMPLSPRS